MTDQLDQMQKMLQLAMRREQAKALAIKRFAEIVTNSDHTQWDALAAAGIANSGLAPDVQDEFAKQMCASVENYKLVRQDALRFLSKVKR